MENCRHKVAKWILSGKNGDKRQFPLKVTKFDIKSGDKGFITTKTG